MRSALLLLLCAGAFAATPVKLIQTAPIQFEHTPSATYQWSARGLGYAFRFENTGTAMRLGDRTLRMTFDKSNPAAPFTGLDHSAYPTNSFHGNKYELIENYGRLRRTGVYPGVDLLYYSRNGELEYDFELAPGADPSPIALRFEGADSAHLNANGDLVLSLAGKDLTQRAPSVYQRSASGELVAVQGAYKIGRDHVVRFHLGKYDRSKALVIDPSIYYVAFLGGSRDDFGVSIGHDALGFMYIGGYTYSTDFVTGGYAYTTAPAGEEDCFILKLNPLATDGSQVIVYSTYYGGNSHDILTAMKVDSAGVVYFTGNTDSTNFPISTGAFSNVLSTLTHAFIVKLDTTQNSFYGQLYSTYLGGTTGNESGQGIFQQNGFIYVTGYTTSSDFPTQGGFQGQNNGSADMFVAKFDPSQVGTASLIFSSYMGGGAEDVGNDVAVDSNGIMYVTGFTYSGDFPYTSATAFSNYAGEGDAFLAVINPGSSTVLYATYYGGPSGFEQGTKIVADPNGQWAAIAGYTLSPDLRVTQNAYQPVMPSLTNVDNFGNQLASNGFLAIFDLTQEGLGKGLQYATFFGGYNGEVIYDLKRDSQGYYYMSGYTMSQNFPVTANALNPVSAGGGLDGFVSVLNPAAAPSSALIYSSYVTSTGTQTVTGLDLDPQGRIWMTGSTTGNIFPANMEQFPLSNTIPPYTLLGKQEAFIWGFTIN